MPDLTAETLAMLDTQQKRGAKNGERSADWYAHAAACVREVAALRARPSLPADVQAVVEKVQPLAEYEGGTRLAYMDTEEAEMLAADLRTLLAHLQRQAAPVVVTEAMVHVASVALADEDGNHEWEALSDKTQHNYYATLRRVLTAALAARGED